MVEFSEVLVQKLVTFVSVIGKKYFYRNISCIFNFKNNNNYLSLTEMFISGRVLKLVPGL